MGLGTIGIFPALHFHTDAYWIFEGISFLINFFLPDNIILFPKLNVAFRKKYHFRFEKKTFLRNIIFKYEFHSKIATFPRFGVKSSLIPENLQLFFRKHPKFAYFWQLTF